MTGRFNRPCLTCGQLTRGGSYCDTHKPVKVDSPERKAKKAARYGPAYQRLAKQIRQTATRCHLCGGGPRDGDPWEADHVIPGSMAGGLAPAHRSCNQKKSNKLDDDTRRGDRGGGAGQGRPHEPNN